MYTLWLIDDYSVDDRVSPPQAPPLPQRHIKQSHSLTTGRELHGVHNNHLAIVLSNRLRSVG